MVADQLTRGTGNCPNDLIPLYWELVTLLVGTQGINEMDGQCATADQ